MNWIMCMVPGVRDLRQIGRELLRGEEGVPLSAFDDLVSKPPPGVVTNSTLDSRLE